MTITKVVLAGSAMSVLLLMFATRPDPLPPAEKDQDRIKSAHTIVLAQMPFDTPSWVPSEATKRKALLKAYELNGNSMCCGSIDVSKEDLTERVAPDAPAHAAAEPVADEAADKQPDWDARRKFMNRTFRATRQQLANVNRETKTEKDVCQRHGMHKVTYGDKWRCRK
jgi:hypothetical protein